MKHRIQFLRRRREFISLLGGAAAGWPLAARAQQAAMPVIGFLGGADPIGYAVLIEAFRSGLRDHGYVEGKNVMIEYRWAEGNYERLPGLAAELVHRKVAIIITQGTPAAFAAKQATTTIPIVIAIVGDPVDSGIVASYSRPGGNITGSSFFFPEINAKRLELMKSLMPGLKRAGVLMNPDNLAMTSVLRAMDEVAKAMDVNLQHVEVRRLDELDSAFAQAKSRIEAHTVIDEGLFVANAKRIAELAIRNRLPGVGFREYCEAGGLAAYGVNFPHIWRRGAVFVDKILKGTKPADLPIEQATRFEFIINLRTARSFGLDVPPTLLAHADKVIE
jgi:putative tryptophan/tyrosine transport system substrate-binding protein